LSFYSYFKIICCDVSLNAKKKLNPTFKWNRETGGQRTSIANCDLKATNLIKIESHGNHECRIFFKEYKKFDNLRMDLTSKVRIKKITESSEFHQFQSIDEKLERDRIIMHLVFWSTGGSFWQ
jgi:hypothetical protein